MKRALDVGEIGVEQMARYLEVNRRTVGSWINGHNRPSAAALRMWAMLTGVSYEWLRDGETVGEMQARVLRDAPRRFPEMSAGYSGEADADGREVVRRQGLEPRTRWLRACRPARRLRLVRRQDRPAVSLPERVAA